MELLQFTKISDDAGEAFIAPIHNLVNKFAKFFMNPAKPVK